MTKKRNESGEGGQRVWKKRKANKLRAIVKYSILRVRKDKGEGRREKGYSNLTITCKLCMQYTMHVR